MTPRTTREFVSTAMSTTVSVQIVGDAPDAERLAAEVFDWFALVEAACSRFDPTSELQRLCHVAPGTAHVSPLLFEVLRVALAVAVASDGAFDPTLGHALQAHGFGTHWRTAAAAPVPPQAADRTWRDIQLDDEAHTVTMPSPTLLDLGGVAKGFALDLAAHALSDVPDCCVVAGGDLICRGTNAAGAPWRTAIVDPGAPQRTACLAQVDAAEYAICTSGDYARRGDRGHHLLDPRTAPVRPAERVRSVTLVAPQAAVADPLATAAFVLGPDEAAPLLEAQQVDALFIDAEGQHRTVHGWHRATFDRVGS